MMGFRGTWMAVIPPPPDTCSGCGATNCPDTIQMYPSTSLPTRITITTGTKTVLDNLKARLDEEGFVGE